jgi:hypothetical protein
VPDGWEKWGLAWDADALRYERAFEMHDDYSDLSASYEERLKQLPVLYMQDNRLAHATLYPFDEVAKTCGAYWESSIAYITALAIHEGAEAIGLYGVDMDAASEYGYQKPNMEYLIGLAKGKGIEVFIPDSSPLLKFSGKFGYAGRYGRNH